MPTYEYRCPEGHEFEVFQRMSDEPGAACPECGRPASRLLSGGGGLLFKGEGFYITDYRSPDYKKKAEAESGGGEKKAGDKAAKKESDAPKGSTSEGGSSGGSGTPSSGKGGSKDGAT